MKEYITLRQFQKFARRNGMLRYVNAVRRHLDSLSDTQFMKEIETLSGLRGGCASNDIEGFTYTQDLHEFVRRNRALCREAIEDNAEQKGGRIADQILDDKTIKGNNYKEKEALRAIYSRMKKGPDAPDDMYSIMAWNIADKTASLYAQMRQAYQH